MGNKNLLLCCLLSIALVSCETPLHMSYETVSDATWEKGKEYAFSFDVSDTVSTYDMSLEIRNVNTYPYQNLWIFVSLRQPDGQTLRDTLEHILADEFGTWQGIGTSIFQSSVPLKTAHRFPTAGTYTIGIRHGMRINELKGIQELGMRIRKHKDED